MVAVLAIIIRLNLTPVSFEYLLLVSIPNFLPSSTELFDVVDVWPTDLHKTGWSPLPPVGQIADFLLVACSIALAVCRAAFWFTKWLPPLPSSDILLFTVRTSSCARPPSRWGDRARWNGGEQPIKKSTIMMNFYDSFSSETASILWTKR